MTRRKTKGPRGPICSHLKRRGGDRGIYSSSASKRSGRFSERVVVHTPPTQIANPPAFGHSFSCPAMVHPGLGPVIDPSIKACCKRKGGHSKSAVRARRCHLAAPASSVDQRTARRRRSSRQTAGEGGCSRRRLSPRLRSGGDGRTVHAYSTRRADNRQRCRASPTSRPSSIRASPFKSSRTT